MGKAALLAGLVTLLMCSRGFAQTPTVMPTATPLPPMEVKNETFVMYDDTQTSLVCLRMTVALVVNITYIDSKGDNRTMVVPVTDDAVKSENSTCNINATTALLYVALATDEGDMTPFFIVFNFTGDNTTTNQHWSLGNMSFVLEEPSTYLPDYEETMDAVEFETTNALHGDSNTRIEFMRSYKCLADQVVNFTTTAKINPFMYVSKLHVQAFHFENSTSGEFDNARQCLLDTAGKANKIVPIAVGAALAGLVVVVLIAYLIGRLRSRRQSSYEALS